MNFSKIKKGYFNPKKIAKKCVDFWNNHSRIFFAIFSFAVLSLGILIWYQNIYKSDWSADQKNEYKNSHKNKVEFKENEFKKVVEEVDRKKEVYGEELKDAKNIFSSYEESSASVETSTDKPAANPLPQEKTTSAPTFP